MPTPTTSSQLYLRPYTDADLEEFHKNFGHEDGTGTYQWFGYQSSSRSRREFKEDGFLNEDAGRLAVIADSRWLGRVAWHRTGWGPSESWCIEIGVLIVGEFRGLGFGTEAQRQLVEYLFKHTRVHRIQAVTDAKNDAEIRSLTKVGFSHEGLLRDAQWRDGHWHTQSIFSMLRNDN